MAIYITGDIHGNPERLSNKRLKPFGLELNNRDIVIVCGDFGIPWNENDKYWLNWLAEKPFTTLFVDGNHENYDLLYSYPVETLFCGKVHKIKDNIFHLMRGEVFNIDGLTFFAFGGATSTDKAGRIEHISWWPQENFCLAEFNNAAMNLEKVNFKVDYVITHTAPIRFLEKVPDAASRAAECKTSIMLSELEPLIDYKHWFFGHFHTDYHRKESVCSWMYKELLPLNSERAVYWSIDPSCYGETINFYKPFDECTAKKYFYGQGEKSNLWYRICCKEKAAVNKGETKQHYSNFIIRPMNRQLEEILGE
jgi:hypothetical protein